MKRTASLLALFLLVVPIALFAHGGSHKKVQGTVEKVEGDVIHVAVGGGKDVDVKTTAETKYVVGKKAGVASDVKAGMRIVIHLTPDGASAEEVLLPEAAKSEAKK